MQRPWRTWLSTHFGRLPDLLDDAGIDWRMSIVRTGTFRRPERGATQPDVFLDWTADAGVFRAAIPQLGSNPRRPVEATTEAMNWGLDRLTFRPNAIPNIVLYINEDDDAALASGEMNLEPPSPGPACVGLPCQARWTAAQGRVNQIVGRLLSQRVRMNMVMQPTDRPSTYQFGDPNCTVLLPGGKLDLAATLSCLIARGEQQSIQGQLLASGECSAGMCTGGDVGRACSANIDCSILARAYKIPRSERQANEFFPGFLNDKIQEQSCGP
jgi:hypothetical protein